MEKKLLNAIMTMLVESNMDLTPAELTFECHRAAGKVLGMPDAYETERRESLQTMLTLENRLREVIEKEDNPKDKLEMAGAIATAANAFDSILEPSRNIELILQMASTERFAHSDFEDFWEDLAEAKSILYVLNSAGELIGDRLFLEQFPPDKVVCLIFRQTPIVTDACVEDVRTAHLEKYALLHPGVDIRGVPLELTSLDFKEAFEGADLVLAKGQANYETLRTSGRECFYLLRSKCDFLAGKLGVKLHDLVFLKE